MQALMCPKKRQLQVDQWVDLVRYDIHYKQIQDLLSENKQMRDEMSVIMNTLADVQKENRQLKMDIDEVEQYSGMQI